MLKRGLSILLFFNWHKRTRVAFFVLAGVLIGLGVLTLRVSNAMSYLKDTPETCMNCHVMRDAYATWQRGSHGRFAVCTDCHLPHDNLVAKTAFKSADGLKHSAVFTFRLEPQVLELSDAAVRVVQANCLSCHANQLSMIRLAGAAQRTCWECHTNIHGNVRSLSSSPHELTPELPDAGLDWMKKGAD